MNAMETRRLTTCENDIQADELIAKLKEANIESFKYDEKLGSYVQGGFLGTVEVHVHEDDYERALLVADAQQASKDDFTPWCPKCGAEDVTQTIEESAHGSESERNSLIVSLVIAIAAAAFGIYIGRYALLGIFLLPIVVAVIYFRPHRYKVFTCKQCGHKFKKRHLITNLRALP